MFDRITFTMFGYQRLKQEQDKIQSPVWVDKEKFDHYVTSQLSTKSAKFQAVFERVRTHDRTLTEVQLAKLQLKDDDVIALCFVLKTNPYVITLNLSGNQLSIESTQCITKLPYVTHLNISNNPDIGNQGIQVFLRNRTLRKLDASYCRITDPSALAQTYLNELNLCNNHVDNAGLAALAKNRTLSTLDLSANNFDLTGISQFKNNPNLQEFALAFNELNDETAPIFVSMRQLNKLNLSGNLYTSNGAKTLAKGATIETLNISDNHIGNSGARALAGNKRLKHLDLETNNKMTYICLKAFQENKTLETIRLQGKNLDSTLFTDMLDARANNATRLNISM